MAKLKVFLLKIAKKLPTVIVTAFFTLLIAFLALGGDISRVFEQVSLIKKVTTVDTKVNKYAVDFSQNSEKVGDRLCQSYIQMLDNDDYAYYFSKDDFARKEKEREGVSDKSIGITIAIKENEKYPTVCFVHSNSPAKKAGIKKGDKLIKINGVSLKEKPIEDAVRLIKQKNTAKINVKRGKKTLEKSVKLGVFVYDSVTYRMINTSCVVAITSFDESTLKQFDKALEFIKKNNAKSVVFDLRNNPGGYVDICAKILDKVLKKGDTVRLKTKYGKITTEYTSDEKNNLSLPFAVIVNSDTASAAEIFAMNMRDLGKGKIVGEKTFGKGIAQTTYDLGDGTAIKFTTETVIDKNGKTYHKKGIEPDYKVKFNEYQNRNYYFLSDKEDSQLQKALEVVK